MQNSLERIHDIREAVASALEKRGLSNRDFLQEIRAGERDDGPFMTGAIAWHMQLQAERER